MLNKQGDLVPYTGNILLYDFLATQRAPVFLRRNLKLFFYANQQELEARRRPLPPTVDSHMIPRETWQFPPAEMAQQYEDQKAFVAVVKALKPLSENGNLSIEPAATQFLPLRIRCQFGLGVWDPDSGAIFCKPSRDAEIVALKTKDGANVFEVKMREGFREPVARWLTPGKVDANTRYEAQLSLNFLNSEDSFEFLDHVQPQRWKQHGDIPTRFIAKWLDLPRFPEKGRLLQLKCSSDNRVTQIGVEIEMHWTHPRGQTVLMEWNEQSKWNHIRAKSLPQSQTKGPAPAPKYHVTFTYTNGRQPGLSVSTRRSKITHIEYDSLTCRHCNQAKFESVNDLKEHLNTRHSLFNYTVEEEIAQRNVIYVRVNCVTAIRAVYSYPKLQNDLSFDGLHCPHCENNSFGTVEELQIHLDHSHDKFQYQHQGNVTTASGVLQIQFHGTLSTSYVDKRASDHVPDDYDITIIAPSEPFDQGAYQDAEHDEWTRRARLEKPRPRPRPQAKSSRVTNRAPKAAVKRKAPDEVVPRPEHTRKRYKVPKTPAGITLFRTSSKRALEPGEYVSESDDELDMTWFNLKKTAHTMSDETGIPPHARAFVKYWDEYIMDEFLTNELFVGDAVIRFAEQARKDGMLQSAGFLPVFRKKVEELWGDRIITDAVHTHLLEMLDQSHEESAQEPPRKRVRFERESNPKEHSTFPSPSTSLTVEGTTSNSAKPTVSGHTLRSREPDKSPRSKGKARMSTHGQTTPQNTDSDGDAEMAAADAQASLQDLHNHQEEHPPYNRCICGEEAEAGVYVRKAIWCENPHCVRHCFHLDCVIDRWKPNPVPNPVSCNWYCQVCESTQNAT